MAIEEMMNDLKDLQEIRQDIIHGTTMSDLLIIGQAAERLLDMIIRRCEEDIAVRNG